MESAVLFGRAAGLWHALGVAAEEAVARMSLGLVLRVTPRHEEALKALNEARTLFQKVSDTRGEALVLNTLGLDADNRGEKAKAQTWYKQALALWESANDLRGKARTLNDLSSVYQSMNELDKALPGFEEALELLGRDGCCAEMASTLMNIGGIHDVRGEKEEALGRFTKALEMAQRAVDRRNEGLAYHNIGGIHHDLGDDQAAIQNLETALSINSQLGDPRAEGMTAGLLAIVYDDLEEMGRALDLYERALHLARAGQDPFWEGDALNSLGYLYDRKGDKTKAREYLAQALEVSRRASDRMVEGIVLDNLGGIEASDENTAKAMEYHRRELELARQIHYPKLESLALGNLGACYRDQGDMAKALEHYERALEISQRISDVKTQAQGLLNSARCLLKLGRLEESRERAKIALQIIESRRSNLASLGLRTSLTSGSQQYFRFYIDTLMQLEEQSPGKDYATIAFEAAERSRARTLLDRLTELRADIRQGVAPELREREKILQKNIRAKARSLGPRAQEQLPRLLAEYEDLQTRIRLSSPRYAALTQPQPVRLTTIQKQLLDPDTLVLEYLLGEERSYLWAVSNERLHAFILPGRSEIESLVRVFNDSLSRPPAAGTSAQGARPDLWRNQAAKVGRLLLAPVWSLLAGKRLLIVPDGILQYLSFPALIVCEPGQESRSRPLIFNHEIVQLTSVTVVNMLREGGGSEMRRVALHPEQPEGTRVAVFADPVYGRDDPRLQGVTHRAAHPAADSQAESLPSEPAWGNAAAAQHFGRLLFSRREGEAIIGLVPHGRARAAFGFEASRSAFADGSLKSFDYIHVASHAVVDDARPELSGIVLSLVDRQGQSQDGYVRLLEIFNLDLPANLVVLSSCRSSVGKEIGGEGMASLTRGFFHAGSSRVVASLWEINDMATSGLMTDFYAGMLGPRHLRQAQSSRWSHPHYWGAFAFHGDWH